MLTVDVQWEKSVVTEDNSRTIVTYFDVAMGGTFAVVLLLCFVAWWRLGRDPKPNPTVPLFYPPVFRGRLLSPGAMDYLWNAAQLTSKGFAGTLLNLAAQKAVTIFGTGTRKSPYAIICSRKSSTDTPTGDNPRVLWNTLLEKGTGFDTAEQEALDTIVANSTPTPSGHTSPVPGVSAEELEPYKGCRCLLVRGNSSWALAQARDAAYMKLAASLQSLWHLRASVDAGMFGGAYVCAAIALGLFYLFWGTGTGWAAACAAMTVTARVTFALFKVSMRLHRVWMMWREMGWFNLALYGLYILLCFVIVVYDCLCTTTTSQPLNAIFGGWAPLRWLLAFALGMYLLWLTHSLRVVLASPATAMGIALVTYVPVGMLYYSIPHTIGAIFFILSLLAPLAFMPVMKQPTEECVKVLTAIRGFGMYLGAAEAERFNVINVPDKTPEEFMRGLPYAVALGMEKAWGGQFADTMGAVHIRGSVLQNMAQCQHRMKD